MLRPCFGSPPRPWSAAVPFSVLATGSGARIARCPAVLVLGPVRTDQWCPFSFLCLGKGSPLNSTNKERVTGHVSEGEVPTGFSILARSKDISVVEHEPDMLKEC